MTLIKHILFKTAVLSLLLASISPAQTAEPNKNEGWGGELNGLRMRLTAPQGSVYSKGKSLPLVIEIKNVSDQPIPLNKLSRRLTYKTTDGNDNLIRVNINFWDYLTSWENADGTLQPGEIIKETCFVDRLRISGINLPSSFKLYIELPTIKIIPDKLPLREYSNPITIQIKDSLSEQVLTSADLPDKWTKDLDIVYRYGGTIWFGDITIHIDGSGQVTTSGDPRNSRRPALNGRHQIKMEPDELDIFIKQLKEFKIERLKMNDKTPPAPDTPLINLSIFNGEKTFSGTYEVSGDKTEPVIELYKIMENFLDKIEVKIKSETGKNDENLLTYTDEKRHFRFQYPRNWKLVSGEMYIAHYHDAFAALNNAGKDNFWVTIQYFPTRNGVRGELNNRVIADLLPAGCVYFDVGWVGGPGGFERWGPRVSEMNSDNLSDLLKKTTEQPTDDKRLTSRYLEFNKWGKRWCIVVYFRLPVSNKDRADANKILESFRFFGVPAGDEIWAIGEARKFLPPEADPNLFVSQGGNDYRYCHAERKGDDVYVLFRRADPNNKESKREWQFRVTQTGEVIKISSPDSEKPKSE